MFKFTLRDPKSLKIAVSAMSRLITEANMLYKPEGIIIQALDSSRIVMVDLNTPKTYFEDYICDREELLGINIELLEDVLRRCKSEELEVLYEDGSGRLKITAKGKGVRTFRIPLLTTTTDRIRTPSFTFKCRANILSDALKSTIDDAALFSDYLKMVFEQDTIIVSASSEKGDLETRLTVEDGSIIKIEVDEPSTASYSIEYLDNIMAASKLSDIMVLQLSTNSPLNVQFMMEGEAKIQYYLAPRVEE
jgi:proliferating cell nuclear antigen